MQRGATLLKDWIKRRGFNQAEAADALGFHEAFISMLVNAKRSPGLNNALHIQRVTGIPVEAWASSHVHETVGTTVVTPGKRRR
jgi:plasmid maintenance system antidote protein VapI